MPETKKASPKTAKDVDPGELTPEEIAKFRASVDAGGNPTVDARELAEGMSASFEKIMQASIPPDMLERLDEINAGAESKYIEHPDKVAILDISTSMLAKTDSIPDPLLVQTDPPQFTTGGLRKVNMYSVRINLVPQAVDIYEWSIRDKKEWDDYQNKQGSSGLLNNQQIIASMIMRQGGDEQENAV